MINRKIPLLIWTFCVLNLAFSYPTATQNTNTTRPRMKEIFADEKSNAKLMNFDVTRPREDNFYRRAAIENGMDPDAVAEVVRTGKPIVKVENDENGMKRTTTYSLQPDGSISRHTKTEYRPTLVSSPGPLVPQLSSSNGMPSQKESDWEWNPINVPSIGVTPSRTDNYPSTNWQVPTYTYARRPHVSVVPDDETTPISTHWNSPNSPVEKDIFNGIDSGTTVTKTFVNGDNTKFTTVHTVGPTEWRTRTITLPWSEFDSRETTTKRPQFTQPSLGDFLKSQYETTMKSPIYPKQATNLFPQKPSTDSTTKPVTTININDLPIVEVLNPDQTLKNRVATTPEYKTQTKTYTRTIQTNGVPQVSDLDPNMKDILEKAGINPTEVLTSKDGTITKTRHEPDGKVITTTYRIRTVPSETNNIGVTSNDFSNVFGNEKPQGPFFVREQSRTAHEPFNENHKGVEFPTINTSNYPSESSINKNWHSVFSKIEPRKNPIDEFLEKVNLTAASIRTSNGEIVKTIIDDNGRVLTASFVLSTVRNDDNSINDKVEKPPIK